MTTLAKWLYLLSLALWLGSIVFFSFVVAPAVFRSLPRAEAGRVLGSIFPIYYGMGYACGGALLASALLLFRTTRPRAASWGAAAVLAAFMLGATLYAGLVVQPRVRALRSVLDETRGAPAAKEEFDRQHRLAVQLNVAVLCGGLIISALTAARLREN